MQHSDCPFCGTHDRQYVRTDLGVDGVCRAYVACNKCQARGPVVEYIPSHMLGGGETTGGETEHDWDAWRRWDKREGA